MEVEGDDSATLAPPGLSGGLFPRVLSCRLCWRVTLAVFTLILVIESVLLVPSAHRFEQAELRRLGDVIVAAVESRLDPGGTTGAARAGALDSLIGPQFCLTGLEVVGPDGLRRLASGEALVSRMPVLARWQEREVQPLGAFDHGARYEIAWRSMTAGEPLTFLARIDASHVRRELYGYLARVAGLVAIIVVVVTAGTMLVLHVWVLAPLLRLRRSMLGAGGAPDKAASFTVPVQRSDELGEVMAAHNRMLAQVAESMRRDREMAEERARFLTRHDTLTGLPNRAALIEQLDRDVQGGGSLFVIGLVRRMRSRGRRPWCAGAIRGAASSPPICLSPSPRPPA